MSDPDQTVDVSLPGLGRENSGDAAPPPPTDDSAFPVGDWDRYEFVKLLGHGGMGAVYSARDRRLGRAVALKFIRGADPKLTMRLINEARAQSRIEHDGVCKVYETGEVQGRVYIAMELVPGRPLGEIAGELALHEKVQVMRDVALALNAAHGQSVLHRDIKPANILVERREGGQLRPVVVDFGLAREEQQDQGLTQSGAFVGTPSYMSPEQARGERLLDRRSDVYSLGVTLYEVLAGAPPFTGDTLVDVIFAVIHEVPKPLRVKRGDLPEDLETIAAKCLEKEPARRYDSAKALSEDLDRYIRGEPILGRKASLWYRARRWAGRRRALVATAAASLVLLAASVGLGLATQLEAQRREADLEEQVRATHQIAQDVKEMEWFLRASHLLPLHDARREEREIRRRMERLAQHPAAGASGALVDYALGRGHLALHEDEPARARLQAALGKGLDLPELQFGLGVALGRLYDRALAEAERGGDPRWVERRKKEIEAQYLTPALASMQRSRAVPLEAPSYLDGLIAYYRKDWQAALNYSAHAATEAPWMYEAVQLQADVHLARGIDRKDHGEADQAAKELEEAARLYDAAAAVGRSDASLYLGAAEAWLRRMELDAFRGRSPAPLLPRAIERSDRAAEARPDQAAPFEKIAYAHGFLVEYLSNRGQDPRPAIADEARAARRALALDDKDFPAWERLASGSAVQADYEMRHGIDARGALDQSVIAARRATEVDPQHPWGHVALGYSSHLRGSAAMASGQDPSADLQAASDEYAAAVRLAPDYTAGYANRLWTLSVMVQARARRGEDPAPLRRDAADTFAACVRANPGWALCYENLGDVDLRLAEYDALAGAPIDEDVAQAQAHLEKAASLDAQYLETYQLLAETHLVAAEAAVDGGRARTAIAAARHALARCFATSPRDPGCRLSQARSDLLAARLPPARPQALLDARAQAARAAAATPRSPVALAALAEADRALAEAGPTAARPRARSTGLATCARGLAIDPKEPRLLFTRAALLLDEARATPPAGRPAAARAAVRAFEGALSQDPLLKRRATPLLDEARRMSEPPAPARRR